MTTADKGGSSPGTPSARLLVVDDEPALMKALCDTLRTEGYEPVGFTSARGALEGLLPGGFDLLLTDLAMPEMDGIALLRAAQRQDPDLVAIIMTGAGTIATAVEAMKGGALDYILKPFKLSAILPVLARALSVRRLRRENAELQRRLAERAAELEAANKELDSFAHSVAHDLRGPLNAVIGFSSLVTRDHSAQLSTEAREHLDDVIAAAKGMDQLIGDLLRFSRAGQQGLSKGRTDIAGLVAEVLEELRGDHVGRAVEVVVGELRDALADRPLLKQVFTNLLSNAFKYTRNREPARVEVGFWEQEGQGVYFVRDNGVGFDLQHATRLFEVFQRMHRRDEFEGTGVGLSLAHRIVERHGGRMWAAAEVDQGATFYFSLPG